MKGDNISRGQCFQAVLTVLAAFQTHYGCEKYGNLVCHSEIESVKTKLTVVSLQQL